MDNNVWVWSPLMTPIISGCGIADLIWRDCSYSACTESNEANGRETVPTHLQSLVVLLASIHLYL